MQTCGAGRQLSIAVHLPDDLHSLRVDLTRFRIDHTVKVYPAVGRGKHKAYTFDNALILTHTAGLAYDRQRMIKGSPGFRISAAGTIKSMRVDRLFSHSALAVRASIKAHPLRQAF